MTYKTIFDMHESTIYRWIRKAKADPFWITSPPSEILIQGWRQELARRKKARNDMIALLRAEQQAKEGHAPRPETPAPL